jgi:hypothetical protein
VIHGRAICDPPAVTTLGEFKCRADRFLARHSFWLGLAVVALALLTGAALSWRRWPDLIVDFGIQLYIPWRLSQGAVLYRDLYYFAGGPLSQYYHALLFKVFGVSFLPIIISNLAVVAALLLVIYRRFAAAAGVWTGTTIGLGVVLVFVFAEYGTLTNYSYLAPYSHEALHGLFLSILALAWLSDWLNQPRLWSAAGAGFCAGLVFLTKPDIFLALAVCAGAAFFLQGQVLKRTADTLKSMAAFVAAGVLPGFGFFLLFIQTENWREAMGSVGFGWRPAFQTEILNNPFYQWCLGLDAPPMHVHALVRQSLAVILAIFLLAAGLRWLAPWKAGPRWSLYSLAVLALGLLAVKFDWLNCGYSLPLFCVLACVLLRGDFEVPARRPTATFPLLWSIFALVLLMKMGFFPRIWHYGFVLAMPAFVSAVYLLLGRLPQRLETSWQVPAGLFRAALWVTLMIGFGTLFRVSYENWSAKNVPVGHGDDSILATGPTGHAVEAQDVNAALDWIDQNISPSASLAVLPEGTLINFLSRRVNPTPDLDWNPTMFPVFSQEKMTAAFEQSPPDYVCVVEWTSYAFGRGYFGREPGYGTDLMGWIAQHYQPVFLAGSEPLKDGRFGIKILKRQAPAP